MACINLYNPFSKERFQLDFDLDNSLSVFREIVSSQSGVPINQQELIFRGECLNDDDKSLASYGIKTNGTIHLLKKHETSPGIDDIPMDEISLKEIEEFLNKARNPIYRQSIRKFVKNKSNMKDIIEENEILKNDPIIKSLLGDSDLVLAILETGDAQKIVEEQPVFGVALKAIIPKASVASTRPSLFQASENDEFDDIDLSSLAQAELVAGGSQEGGNAESNSQTQQISAADLANALSSIASMGVVQNNQGPSTPSQALTEEQINTGLEQMRAVGITSDATSRQALVITGGNIEAAINLIFEGTLSRMMSDD